MKTVDKYLLQFNELPKLSFSFDYDSEVYVELMEKALKRGTKITQRDIDEAFAGLKYDTEI